MEIDHFDVEERGRVTKTTKTDKTENVQEIRHAEPLPQQIGYDRKR